MNKTEILDSVNWQAALAAERRAGGHAEVMLAMFADVATVADAWIEDDYQGELAFAYEFPDGTVLLVTDYYGSCSGCDAWEDCSDADARELITSMVTSGRIFPTIGEATDFCRTGTSDAAHFSHQACSHLFPESYIVGLKRIYTSIYGGLECALSA